MLRPNRPKTVLQHYRGLSRRRLVGAFWSACGLSQIRKSRHVLNGTDSPIFGH